MAKQRRIPDPTLWAIADQCIEAAMRRAAALGRPLPAELEGEGRVLVSWWEAEEAIFELHRSGQTSADPQLLARVRVHRVTGAATPVELFC